MWLVCGKSKHDQICVLAVHAMSEVGLIPWLAPLVSDELHDLVLALSWNVCAAKDDLQVAPHGILLNLFPDKPPAESAIISVNSVWVAIDWMYAYLICLLTVSMNSVPGVMQLESNIAPSSTTSPRCRALITLSSRS